MCAINHSSYNLETGKAEEKLFASHIAESNGGFPVFSLSFYTEHFAHTKTFVFDDLADSEPVMLGWRGWSGRR